MLRRIIIIIIISFLISLLLQTAIPLWNIDNNSPRLCSDRKLDERFLHQSMDHSVTQEGAGYCYVLPVYSLHFHLLLLSLAPASFARVSLFRGLLKNYPLCVHRVDLNARIWKQGRAIVSLLFWVYYSRRRANLPAFVGPTTIYREHRHH